MTTITEQMAKIAQEIEGHSCNSCWSDDHNCQCDTEKSAMRSMLPTIRAALREFGEELAKLCEAQKIGRDFPGYAAHNAAFTRCAAAIRAAIRESL